MFAYTKYFGTFSKDTILEFDFTFPTAPEPTKPPTAAEFLPKLKYFNGGPGIAEETTGWAKYTPGTIYEYTVTDSTAGKQLMVDFVTI